MSRLVAAKTTDAIVVDEECADRERSGNFAFEAELLDIIAPRDLDDGPDFDLEFVAGVRSDHRS